VKKTILMILLIPLVGCAQLAQTAGKISPRIGETANRALGIKNYRYEHVDGEPDQRLIIVTGSSSYSRNTYRKEAISNACPEGTKTDVLALKDNPKKAQMKIVVWCEKRA